jgi:hypothetical protein
VELAVDVKTVLSHARILSEFDDLACHSLGAPSPVLKTLEISVPACFWYDRRAFWYDPNRTWVRPKRD